MSIQSASSEASQLLDINSVSQLLGCSSRHVKNLTAKGEMPSPIKLGSLVRWQKSVITDWIANGCKEEVKP